MKVFIKGYEGYYISTDGEVENARTGRKLKPQVNNCGYLRVELCSKGKKKKHFVHRLVAVAYIKNPDNLPQVNHKNGNKKDNRAKNLEWRTASENRKHSFRELGEKPTVLFGSDNGKTKIHPDEIINIKSMSRSMTYKEIASIYNCNPKYIGMIVRGERRA